MGNAVQIVELSKIAEKNGGPQKGDGLAIQTNTGIMSFIRGRGAGNPVIIGKLLLGPLCNAVPLGNGERLLEINSGPLRVPVFYKFKDLSAPEKNSAL